MTERDQRNPQADWNDRRDRDDFRAPRQPQQWHDESYGSGQFGSDDRTRSRDYGGGQFGAGQQGGSSGSYSGYSSGNQRSWQDEDARTRREHQFGSGDYGSDNRSDQRSYGGGSGGYGSGYYSDRESRFGSFTSEDQGGRDFSSDSARQGPYIGRSNYGYVSGSGGRDSGYASSYGNRSSGNDDWLNRGPNAGYHPRGYVTSGRDYIPDNSYNDWRSYGESRGFFARAGDEVASWFGDEDAARRREQDHRDDNRGDSRAQGYRGDNHRGRGPSDYTRSDERIREDANDALTHDHRVDASHVTVKVEKGEVTLDGTVDNREAKRRAEDAVDRISGVKHVQNNLRVNEDHNRSSSSAGSSATSGASTNNTWSAGSGSTTGASTNHTGTGGTASGSSTGNLASGAGSTGSATKTT